MERYEITKEAIEYVCKHTHRFRDNERTRAICEMRLAGHSAKEIGEKFNLSPGRCQEICERVCRIYAGDLRMGKIKEEKIITLYDRIKAMPLDEMASFFAYLYSSDIIAEADRYICRKCKEEHGWHCPIGDDDKCLYELSDKETIKLWLQGGAYAYVEKG